MKGDPTVRQLVSAGTISNADVEAAGTAYLAAPDPRIVPLGPDHEVDIIAAIATHAFTAKFLKSGQTGRAGGRAAVRSATMAARARRS